MIFIAEVKLKSPFGFKSSKTWDELFDVANKHGDWISIHTNPRWGGLFEDIKKAKAKTHKPILAKGLHQSDQEIERALVLGADYVLTVNTVPDKSLISKCLLEMSSYSSLLCTLEKYPDAKVVYNTKSPFTGFPRAFDVYNQYRKSAPWLCYASGITQMSDIPTNADAFLIGQNLMDFCNEKQKV